MRSAGGMLGTAPRRALLAVAALVAATLGWAPPAAAVPNCATTPSARMVASGQGRLESIVGDPSGRLFYTDLNADRLLRLDAPGAQPVVLATGIARPGGLAWDADGSLLAGSSGGALSGVPRNAMAGIYRIDPETGAKRLLARGFDQANGLVRTADGSLLTSNNIGGEIVRVLPDGSWAPWADLDSPNGLALDVAGEQLYAAETFRPARIVRVPLADPARPVVHFEAPLLDVAAGLDGMVRDDADRLFVAANGAGEVWRVDADGDACALARGLGMPSAVAFGGGPPGFERTSLFVVTFGGSVVELPGATDAPPAPQAG